MRVRTSLIAIGLAVVLTGHAPAWADSFTLRDVPDIYASEEAGASLPPAGSLGGWMAQQSQPSRGEPSLKRAIGYSLLVPGWGEYYLGRTGRARAFWLAEGAIWTSFIVLRAQGHLRETSYKEDAVQFAGISGTDHTDEFYKTIGIHDSSDDYERDIKQDARFEIYPDVGYEALDRYYINNRLTDFEEWAWSSSDRRIDYRELRISSRLAYRRSWYMLAAAAANRIVSAISVYQVSRSNNSSGGVQTGSYRLDFGLPAHDARGDYTTAVSLIRTF